MFHNRKSKLGWLLINKCWCQSWWKGMVGWCTMGEKSSCTKEKSLKQINKCWWRKTWSLLVWGSWQSFIFSMLSGGGGLVLSHGWWWWWWGAVCINVYQVLEEETPSYSSRLLLGLQCDVNLWPGVHRRMLALAGRGGVWLPVIQRPR